jgi:lipopolysaccharide export LptBFGC system permease protein LptF
LILVCFVFPHNSVYDPSVRLSVDKYLVREILPPFLVALLAFLVFIGLELILSLSDALFSRGVSAAALLRLLSFKLPYILTLAAPAGVLLATFLALARLASDRELLAFQALGYSLRRLLLPFLGFGLMVSALSFVFSEFVVPNAEASYRRELLALLYRGPVPLVQENVFFRGPQGELFYVERYLGEKVEGVVVYDLAGQLYPRSSFPAVITAKEGSFSSGQLLLRDGRVLHFGSQGELTEILGFQELSLTVGEGIEEALLGSRTPSEMSTRELRERIELLRKSGVDVRDLLVEYHGKLAVAAAAFVFVLFGAPLGAILGHRGRATGMIVGFLLAAGAQALFLWARTLARRGLLPPALGGWLPHLVFGTVGLLLFLGTDRLRFRGLLLFLVLGVTGFAAPPFRELVAEELVVEADGKVFLATQARLTLGDYTLTADHLSLREEETWLLEAQEVTVAFQDSTVRAKFLKADLTKDGILTKAELQGFSGEAKFSGPEKEETLLFSADEGEAEFNEGELAKVFGKNVMFTTCSCTSGAPYLIQAGEFLLLPGKWLFARDLRLSSFGYPIVWLPIYAARLGEESVPFLPEVGTSLAGWFLRWSFPWTPTSGTVGAVILTLYPQVPRVEPALWVIGDAGSLFLSSERATVRYRGEIFGEPWSVQGRYDPSGLLLSLEGRIRGWQVRAAAGLAESETTTYLRIPEISFSQGFKVWGGDFDLTLGFGRYREGEVEGWRASLAGTWTKSAELFGQNLQIPVSFGLDQYPKTERVYLTCGPALSLGSISLWYQWQMSIGRSAFTFDSTPSQNQVGLSFQASERGWTQSLVIGWDFLTQNVLPLRWTVKSSNFSASFTFGISPLSLWQGKWTGSFQGPTWLIQFSGGVSQTGWEDLVVRGRLSEKSWEVEGGVRLGWPEVWLKRVALSAQGVWSAEWSWALALEYDFPTARFVQFEASLFRTFLGCLRLGLSAYSGGFRLSLDIPAFPEAKIEFAPMDEGLGLGGL